MSKNNSNGNSTVKWVGIIAILLMLIFGSAYGAVQVKLMKHDDLIMKISVDVAEIKTNVKYLRERAEKE